TQAARGGAEAPRRAGGAGSGGSRGRTAAAARRRGREGPGRERRAAESVHCDDRAACGAQLEPAALGATGARLQSARDADAGRCGAVGADRDLQWRCGGTPVDRSRSDARLAAAAAARSATVREESRAAVQADGIERAATRESLIYCDFEPLETP